MKFIGVRNISLFALFLGLMSFIIWTCKPKSIEPIEPWKGEQHITGAIFDKDSDEPLSGVKIEAVGIASKTSDSKGEFDFGITDFGDPKKLIINFSKESYEVGQKVIKPNNSSIINFTYFLIEVAVSEQINITSGGTVNIPSEDNDTDTSDNAVIVIPPNTTVVDEETGDTVSVDTVIFNVTHVSQTSIINDANANPIGSFDIADTASGTDQVIVPFGMISINMTDEQGNPLQLAGGSTVQVSFPIDPAAQNTAPPVSTLLSYGQSQADWSEEGDALIDSTRSKYTANLDHFSWWTVAQIRTKVTYTGNITCSDGNRSNPVGSGYRVVVKELASGSFDSYSAEDGSYEVETNFPQNATGVTLRVYFPDGSEVTDITVNQEGTVIDIILNSDACIVHDQGSGG